MHFKKLNFILLVLTLSLSSVVWAAEKVPLVSVVEAKQGNLGEVIPLTGSVTSLRTSQISPKEEGYIDKLMVDEGDRVNKGDPLLSYDRQLVEVEITRVRAQITEAKARVKELERQRDEAAELVKKKHIASTSYEAAAAEVEINKAVIKRLEAELSRQKIIAARHTLYAPFEGVITEKMVEVGQWVDTNTSLFELTELNPLRIEVPVPQFYFSRINIGTRVRIKYDAIPDTEFVAEISNKVPVSSQNTRTFPIMIQVSNEQELIAPGMSARVFIELTEENRAATILLPRDAIVLKPDGTKTVWLVADKDGLTKVSPIVVETGKSYQNTIEIEPGLIHSGDRIVVKGNELLQPDQLVNIVEERDYNL